MRALVIIFMCTIWMFPASLEGQTHINAHPDNKGHLHSDEFKNWRVAALIGHTLIPSSHQRVFIPSWGLDIEYWSGRKFGLGLHSDIELEQFIIYEGTDEEVERVTPLVLTADVLWKPWKNLVLLAGPGVEIESSEKFSLMRIGAEYEFEIGNHFDVAPSLMYDDRLDGYHTWSFMLGIGKRL